MKIYFLTRTFVLDKKFTDCGNIRNRYVELLSRRYDVVVVTPNYENDEIIENRSFIRVPYKYRRVDYYAERLGIVEDYFDKYTQKCIEQLSGIVREEDIIFATTGGELSGIKIASKLKELVGCKIIVNFHDPVNFTTVNGKKTGGGRTWLHVNRDNISKKYIRNADYIITSSDSYRRILEKRFPYKHGKIANVYFGFLDELNVSDEYIKEKPHSPIRLVYAGSMGQAQLPEQMMDVWGDIDNIRLEYIGNIPERMRKKAKKIKNVSLRPPMEHTDFLSYMVKEADIGLVSLVGEEWGACFPSKIFDLINLCIPILGVLPDGDAKDKINVKYGYVSRLDEKEQCIENLNLVMENYHKIVGNMRSTKKEWSMEVLFAQIYEIVESVYKNS